MRKKLLSMILATTMVATALVGCGAKEEKAAAPAEQATEETKEEPDREQ